MISEKMKYYVANSSATRAMFEEGQRMAREFGAENVYDFSLGNPCTPAPDEIADAVKDIIDNEPSLSVHGYMNNAGFPDVRGAIAEDINKKHGTAFGADNILMTVGAAGGLNVILKTVLDPGDEVITFTPFFSEYRFYAANYGAELVMAATDPVTFMPDTKDLAEKITAKTKALIINNPNNPTGVVYGEEEIKAVAAVLEEAKEKYGNDIYLISDEPYRELVYDGVSAPYITKYYRNAIVGYSYSKSLSLPGERIGYLVIPNEVADYDDVWNAAVTANRILGYVNAPSLMQKVVAKCLEAKTDVGFYDRNRKAIYEALTSYGFECVKPEGAFYLWIKSPVPDETEFVNAAKKEHILLVAGTGFGCPGYIRLAYCVSYDTIINSLPGFERLAKEFF